MARSTGIVLLAGGITLANEVAFAPISSGGKITSHFNWRIIPATGLAALALAGIEQLAPGFAVGIAWLMVATVLFVPLGNAPTPIDNVSKALGFTGKVK